MIQLSRRMRVEFMSLIKINKKNCLNLIFKFQILKYKKKSDLVKLKIYSIKILILELQT